MGRMHGSLWKSKGRSQTGKESGYNKVLRGWEDMTYSCFGGRHTEKEVSSNEGRVTASGEFDRPQSFFVWGRLTTCSPRTFDIHPR